MDTPTITRRTALTAGLIPFAAVGLAACGGSAPGDASGGSGASVWIMSGVTETTFQGSFDRWNQNHQDQAFATQTFANDAYKQKIRTAIGSGGAPTLIYGWGGGGLRSYVDDEVVADISDLMAETAIADRFLPAVAAGGKVDDKFYAVPNNGVKPVMVYYNKDLFAQVGVEPATTWSELLDQVPAFLAAGIAPFTVAGQARWPLLPWLAYLVDRIGGPEVFNDITSGVPDSWSHPAVLQATEMIQEFVDAGGFVDGFASVSTESGADTALLYTGQAAMSLGLPATYQNVKTAAPEFIADGKLGYAPFPSVDGGTGDPANVTGNPSNYWSISATATEAEQEIAKGYIRENLLDEQYASDLLAGGNVPPSAGADDLIAQTDDPDYYQRVYDLTVNAPNFQLSLDQAVSPEQAEALLNNLQQVFLGQQSPEEFVAAMNATIEA